MRILTVRPPWAQMIVRGDKAVENRVRNLAGDYRGLVAIHAGLRVDTEALFDQRVKDTRGGRPMSGVVETGVILGVANLWAVHQHDGSAGMLCCPNAPRYTRWAEANVWHLCLATPRALRDPIPYKGALGLRTLDDDTTARVLAQIGA